MQIRKIVGYSRVSTERQGQSGLGLEAQQMAIKNFAESRGAQIIAEFTEVESGSNNQGQELENAKHRAKITGATLVIAKLDRLSRNAAFLLSLRDSGLHFIAADMPEANELTVGIMALVAEQERRAISRRTREALAAAKARGVQLGNPHGARYLQRAGKGNVAAIARNQALAQDRAQDLVPVLADIQERGVYSATGIASELNRRGILTARNGRWHATSVLRLQRRLTG